MKFSIVPSRPGDEPALRALWQDVFGDGKDFLDDFFRLIYRPGMAQTAWAEDGTLAAAGSAEQVLTKSFLREIGLPTRWSEMGITDETVLRAAADTCLLMPGCCKQFTRDELFEVLKERL